MQHRNFSYFGRDSIFWKWTSGTQHTISKSDIYITTVLSFESFLFPTPSFLAAATLFILYPLFVFPTRASQTPFLVSVPPLHSVTFPSVFHEIHSVHASSLALGVVHEVGGHAVEDGTWLRHYDASHINMAELDAAVKGINLVIIICTLIHWLCIIGFLTRWLGRRKWRPRRPVRCWSAGVSVHWSRWLKNISSSWRWS